MTQPKALRLASELVWVKHTADWTVCDEASIELRRLHAELELQTALVAEAQAMTAKVCAENESLRADAERAARTLFDAGWKACARFCGREDAVFDGIVGNEGCQQFEQAFSAARKEGK